MVSATSAKNSEKKPSKGEVLKEVKTGPQELTAAEVQILKEKLLQTRQELHNKAKERKADGLYEITREPDETDLASAETAHDVDLKLAEHDQHKLFLIERALKKIELDDGEYGICEGTGEPIGFRRLEIQPWTPHSLRYQEELERGRR